MKMMYGIGFILMVSGLHAKKDASNISVKVAEKISHLEEKFSHMQELVSIFESIAHDIALLIEIKHGIHKTQIDHWLIENNLVRLQDRRLDQSNGNQESTLFNEAFKKLLEPKFAYLRRYIQLQNQLAANGIR